MTDTIQVGTRRSLLAQVQTQMVVDMLRIRNPHIQFSVVQVKAEGDEDLRGPNDKPVHNKEAFTKNLEDKLANGEIDVAVHSLKDLPAQDRPGLEIAAVPKREDARDVLISAGDLKLSDLPKGSRVGTSSLRRKYQLLALRPDLQLEDIRGNVDTRIRKIREKRFDAIIVAAAGLIRLGMSSLVAEYLSTDVMLPAAGQGALAVEVRRGDSFVGDIVRRIDHFDSRAAVQAERAFVERLGGGCNLPVAAHGSVVGDRLTLKGLVASVRRQILRASAVGEARFPQPVGYQMADKMLSINATALVGEVA